MSKTVCIFAGARGKDYLHNDAAWIASGLVKTGWDIIYGGSSRGVMGAVCSAVKEAGGRIIGVLPQKVYELKHYDPEIEMLVGQTMAERKQHFWDRSDAFICLPGSYGSMDELFEVLTLTKLGYLQPKPIVIYNQNGFYTPLIQLFSNMVEAGMMGEDRAALATFCTTPWEVLDKVNGS
jgi:hypothetical protein